jgi:hypothetical protein
MVPEEIGMESGLLNVGNTYEVRTAQVLILTLLDPVPARSFRQQGEKRADRCDRWDTGPRRDLKQRATYHGDGYGSRDAGNRPSDSHAEPANCLCEFVLMTTKARRAASLSSADSGSPDSGVADAFRRRPEATPTTSSIACQSIFRDVLSVKLDTENSRMCEGPSKLY